MPIDSAVEPSSGDPARIDSADTRSSSSRPPGTRITAGGHAARESELLLQAIAAAGAEYRRGGREHQTGFDCSGLVAHVFRTAWGVKLPHGSRAQSGHGRSVGLDELQPGDLVFFNTQKSSFSHVGIFIGEGRFIHAPKPGSAVRTEHIAARYWSERFDGARRISPR